jgi:hypothetical protein
VFTQENGQEIYLLGDNHFHILKQDSNDFEIIENKGLKPIDYIKTDIIGAAFLIDKFG